MLLHLFGENAQIITPSSLVCVLDGSYLSASMYSLPLMTTRTLFCNYMNSLKFYEILSILLLLLSDNSIEHSKACSPMFLTNFFFS